MGIFHTALFVLTLSVANIDLSVPLYRTTLIFEVYLNGTWIGPPWENDERPTGTDAFRLVPAFAEFGSLYLTATTASFFFISAFFHFLNLWSFPYYIDRLEKCQTPLRWIEYFLSAPVMFVLVAYSMGTRSVETIAATAVLIAITMPFGYWVELGAKPCSNGRGWVEGSVRKRLLPWALGHVPQATAWGILIGQLYGSGLDEPVPWFVYCILWAELFLFWSFGFVTLGQQCVQPYKFYKGEIWFQVLSLVSKGVLGGLLLANVLMAARFEDIYD